MNTHQKGRQIASERDYQPDRPASSPTTARPGSDHKVLVIAQRLKRREELWHPEDERMPVADGHANNE